MKLPLRLAIVLLFAAVTACVPSDPGPHQGRLESLGKSASRQQVYEALPPLTMPTPNPVIVFSSGVRGHESYPVSDEWELTYIVLYADSPTEEELSAKEIALIVSGQDSLGLKATPRDQLSDFALRSRDESRPAPADKR